MASRVLPEHLVLALQPFYPTLDLRRVSIRRWTLLNTPGLEVVGQVILGEVYLRDWEIWLLLDTPNLAASSILSTELISWLQFWYQVSLSVLAHELQHVVQDVCHYAPATGTAVYILEANFVSYEKMWQEVEAEEKRLEVSQYFDTYGWPYP